MTPEQQKSNHDEMTSLVEEVMHGRKLVLIPPGGLLSSLFVPILGIGTMSLAFMLTARFFPLSAGSDNNELSTILVPMGVALLLMAVGMVGFIGVIMGLRLWAKRLVFYILGLLGAAIVLSVLALSQLISVPLGIRISSVVAFIICLGILRSLSFHTLNSFFSAKHAYRKKLERR